MKKPNLLPTRLLGASCAVLLTGLLSLQPAKGQILVSTATCEGNNVAEFNLDGTSLNDSLVSGTDSTTFRVAGSDLYVLNHGNGTVAQYTTEGTLIDSSFISGLNSPLSMAFAGSSVLVANSGCGTDSISKYSASTGTMIGSAPLISGLTSVGGMAVSGSDLFVANREAGTILEFNINTGAMVGNGPVISGLNDPYAITISGSDLFVVNHCSGTVGEYTTSGVTVNSALVSGLTNPYGIALSGSKLYVSSMSDGEGDYNTGSVGEYTLNSALAGVISSDPSLVTGLNYATGIAVESAAAVPEPASWMLMLAVVVLLIGLRSRVRTDLVPVAATA